MVSQWIKALCISQKIVCPFPACYKKQDLPKLTQEHSSVHCTWSHSQNNVTVRMAVLHQWIPYKHFRLRQTTPAAGILLRPLQKPALSFEESKLPKMHTCVTVPSFLRTHTFDITLPFSFPQAGTLSRITQNGLQKYTSLDLWIQG